MSQFAGSENRSSKPETGNWKLETGNWKLETGNWKVETGNPKIEDRPMSRWASEPMLQSPIANHQSQITQ